MKPKEYLMQALKYKRKYKHALEDLEYIRSMANGVTAIRYDKDQVQTSPENDQMANYMIRLEKAEARALKAAEDYFDFYEKIRAQINAITPQMYSDILWCRYISGMKLFDIAEDLNFSYGYTKHLHGLALIEFGKRFPEASER